MTAFIFVPLLAMTCIFAGALWTYVSHLFVGITEETAAGIDVVFADDDPMLDWLVQGVHLAWLAGVWVAPALLLARVATSGLDEPLSWYVAALIVIAVFWLAFPISLLSSMSAASRMAVVSGGLFVRLARRGGDVLRFYLLTGLIMAACVPLAPWLFTGSGYLPFIVAGPLLALAVLLHARLMGRLACLARLTPIRSRKKGKKSRPAKAVEVLDPWEVPAEVRAADAVREGGFRQPRDLPPIDSPFEGEMSGYDVRFDDELSAEAKPPPLPHEAVPVAEDDAAVERNRLAHAQRQRQDISAIVPDPLEMQRNSRERARPPERPWADASMWLFLLQPRASTAWAALALGIGLFGAMVQGLVVLWPF